jgi:hypothetical protein
LSLLIAKLHIDLNVTCQSLNKIVLLEYI